MKRLLRALALCLLALTLLCASVLAESKTDWEYIEYYYSLFCDENRDDLARLIEIDGQYDDVVNVGIYLFVYGELPRNYVTKAEARELGWSGGPLWRYLPGRAIGGDHFGNYEGLLPDDDNISYTECDIDTINAGSRGAKRLVYDNEGRIYYTEDHYESFTLLYEEGMYDAN